jgi:hypothetical protein
MISERFFLEIHLFGILSYLLNIESYLIAFLAPFSDLAHACRDLLSNLFVLVIYQ